MKKKLTVNTIKIGILLALTAILFLFSSCSKKETHTMNVEFGTNDLSNNPTLTYKIGSKGKEQSFVVSNTTRYTRQSFEIKDKEVITFKLTCKGNTGLYIKVSNDFNSNRKSAFVTYKTDEAILNYVY